MTTPDDPINPWSEAVLALILAVALVLLDRGPITTPPLSDPSGWLTWVRGQDPVAVPVALGRLVALVVAVQMFLVSAVAGMGVMVRSRRLVGVASRLQIPGTRRTAARFATIWLTLAALMSSSGTKASAAPLGPPAGPPSTARLERVDPTSPVPGTATMERTPAHHAEPPTTAPAPAAGASGPALESSDQAGRAESVDHRVEAGDNLWLLAGRATEQRLGRPGSEHEITRYWRQVLLANPQLTNPDLLFPGEVITLPPPVTAPTPPVAPRG